MNCLRRVSESTRVHSDRRCFTAGLYGRVAGEAAVMLSPSGSYILHTGVTDACRADLTVASSMG